MERDTLLFRWKVNRPNDIDEKTAFDLLNEIIDRQGIGDEWMQIDDEIQNEILEAWLKIIRENK